MRARTGALIPTDQVMKIRQSAAPYRSKNMTDEVEEGLVYLVRAVGNVRTLRATRMTVEAGRYRPERVLSHPTQTVGMVCVTA